MKNLIYQYWDGNLTPGCKAGVENMKRYAKSIGVEYQFEHNPRYFKSIDPKKACYYGAFKPIFDEYFHQYDNVLFTDTDVFAVDGLNKNIFDDFEAELGICTEPFQPEQRKKIPGPISHSSDEKWASVVKQKWNVQLPRNEEGLLKVYNSGVVLYSNDGLKKAKERFVPFQQYITTIQRNKLPVFYTLDQPYLHAMLIIADIDYVEMDNGWNSYIHPYYTDSSKKVKKINDSRDEYTKFVHVQLHGADHLNADAHWKIVNLPEEEWKIR